MALDFPASPVVGAVYQGPGSVLWQWDGVKWFNATGSIPAGVIISATPPTANPGQQWFDSVGGQLYIRYDDGNTQQWVPSANITGLANAATTMDVDKALNDVGRNLIHNSGYTVQQRGGSPWTAGGIYTADRWFVAFSGGSTSVQLASMTDAVRTAIGDEAARMQFVHAVVGTAAAADFYQFRQPIEDVRRLAGKTVIVSFWCSANTGTPKVGVNLYQNMGTGGTPTGGGHGPGQSVTVSPTWTRYSLTFTVPTTIGFGIGTNNDSATNLNFWLSAGANSSAPSGGIGQQSNTFSFWGVQLEIVQPGQTVPTKLEKRDPVLELQQCQRFYFTLAQYIVAGYAPAGINVYGDLVLPVTMRAAPSSVTFGSTTYSNASGLTALGVTAAHLRLVAPATATGAAYALSDVFISADL